MLAGLPLAFLATGLRFLPIAYGVMQIPSGARWLAGLIRKPDFGTPCGHHDEDEGDHEYQDDDEGAYHLDEGQDEPGAAPNPSPPRAWPSGRRAGSSATVAPVPHPAHAAPTSSRR